MKPKNGKGIEFPRGTDAVSVVVKMTKADFEQLQLVAATQCRTPAAQLRWMVRNLNKQGETQ